MNTELFDALELLEKTKGIPTDYMLEKVEAALVSAFKKEYGTTSVRVDINKEKKDVRVFKRKTVVESVNDPRTEISLDEAHEINRRYEVGDIVEEEIKTKSFGRISAGAAKQVIVQGIREAEKNNIAREYEKRKEDVMTALVTKRDDSSGDVWVDTGTSEVVLPRGEQINADKPAVGDRIRVFVTEITRDENNEPNVFLSRTNPQMLKRMLEADIPEVKDGTVLVKAVAREAGSRSKVAVMSRNTEVDPVGACIGNKGSRISAIVEELKGEKIDVIKFSDKPEEFIAAALSPANAKSVEFDGERSAHVTVSSDQLSLAIGKEGQNVRLAAKLTGYKIDIKGIKADAQKPETKPEPKPESKPEPESEPTPEQKPGEKTEE